MQTPADAAVNEMLLYEHTFQHGLRDWRIEGAAKVEIADGHLLVDAIDSVTPGSTVWCTHQFSGNIRVQYDACILPPVKRSNINLFVFFEDHATVHEERVKTAEYGIYHEHKTYIVTYLNEEQGHIRIRLRKCPGFELLREVRLDEKIPENVVQHLEFMHNNGRLTWKANGKTLLQYDDARPYTAGMIGLRTWNTRLWWDNIKVYRLTEPNGR